MTSPLLSVKNLHIGFYHTHGVTNPIEDISFEVIEGQTTALVGESGSGKSLSALSILRLLPYPQAFHNNGVITFQNQCVLDAHNVNDRNKIYNKPLIEDVRRKKIAFIFQEPMTSLNPLHTVERLIGDSALVTGRSFPKGLQNYILELLRLVEFQNPQDYMHRYPHQLSGGQRQRIMIAMALACQPALLIADEPTTALDVTTQAQILNLLVKLQKEQKLTILFISHDLGIVRHLAHNVYVLHNGKVVESGPTTQVLSNPQHSYTKSLVNSEPSGKPITLAAQSANILKVESLNTYYGRKNFLSKKKPFHALKNITFELKHGETLGIVGESGSGKSTLGLSILRLISSTGCIRFYQNNKAIDLNQLSSHQLKKYRHLIQIVFQDPFASLNPRLSVFDIISEGAAAHKLYPQNRELLENAVIQHLKMVELSPEFLYRYPHELSGGQRQRIAIARSLILNPQILVLDEPTSALDRQIQKEVLGLLRKLQEKTGIAYLFISHDLKVIRTLAHRVIIMKNGEVCESGPTENIFQNPQHSYTRDLITSALAYS